jgi:CheY-like chemotaxis protein
MQRLSGTATARHSPIMPKILVVDDDPDLRELWATVLAAEGHAVVTAAEGATGIASYHETQPDVVITDLQLPEFPGLALIARVRGLRADARIVAVSGDATMLREARELGATTALRKPVDIPELVAAVRSLLSGEHGDAVTR